MKKKKKGIKNEKQINSKLRKDEKSKRKISQKSTDFIAY